MTRRSAPQSKVDTGAFPITLRVLVPERGFASFGMDNDPFTWLQSNVGAGEFANWLHYCSLGDAVELHFREPAPMLAFLERFPMLVLADATMSPFYKSPAVPFGRKEVEEVCNLYSMTRTQDVTCPPEVPSV